MAYDFQAAVDAAKAVVEKSENSGGNSSNYSYPLIYPQSGNTITVRLLFNPASGQILRLINRHEKTPCYRTYGIECPICKVMQQVKDVTGQDPFGRSKSSRSRGLVFAQYISSTNVIDKGNNRGNLQAGEIILLMHPWSVYQQINSMIQAIAQTPTGMDQAFCHSAQGLFVQIGVTSDYKYTTTQVPYMTFQTVGPDGRPLNDDEFMKMLDGMESLSNQVIPSQITEEVDKQVKEYADTINRQYIAPRVPTHGVPAGTAPVNFGGGVATTPAVVPGAIITPTPSTVPTPTPAVAPGGPQTVTLPYVEPSPPTNTLPFEVTPPSSLPFVPDGQAPAYPTYSPAPMNPTTSNPNAAPNKLACFGQHKEGTPMCICCPDEMTCRVASQS